MKVQARLATLLLAVASATAMGVSAVHAAPVLNLDFGPTGHVQSTNNFQGFSITGSSGSASYSPITTGSSSGTIVVGVAGVTNILDRGTGAHGTATALSGPYADFYRDWIGHANGSSAMTISGLNATTDYILTIHAFDSQHATTPTNGSATITDTTIGGLGNSATATYYTGSDPSGGLGISAGATPAVLNVRSDANGGLSFALSGGGNRINGFELASVPEPASLGLLGLGGLMMLKRRSRRSQA